jgi:hypothetical protein
MDAGDIKIIVFFFDEAVNEFRGTEHVVDEDIVEEANVCTPLFQIFGHKHGENIAYVSGYWAVDFYAFHYFSGCLVILV